MPRRIYSFAYASFRVYGETLDPLSVTLALRLPPDHTHRCGEPRLTRTKKGQIQEYAPYRFGMWSMSSQQWVNSPQLSVHLQWMLNQLEPRAVELATLRSNGAKADFFCYSQGSVPEPPSLPRVVRERAKALGVAIEIDHYEQPVNNTQ